MDKYLCLVCGYLYDEFTGAPEDGVAPKTPWVALPLDWRCPECDARREDFQLVGQT